MVSWRVWCAWRQYWEVQYVQFFYKTFLQYSIKQNSSSQFRSVIDQTEEVKHLGSLLKNLIPDWWEEAAGTELKDQFGELCWPLQVYSELCRPAISHRYITPHSPEVRESDLKQRNSTVCDVWSKGTVLCMLSEEKELLYVNFEAWQLYYILSLKLRNSTVHDIWSRETLLYVMSEAGKLLYTMS